MKRLIRPCAGAFVLLAGCASPTIAPPPTPAPLTLAEVSMPESVDPYRTAGFLVGGGSIPFVGLVRFAATEHADSTNVVMAVSIPPRALSFVRAGDRYVAYYAMRIDVMRGDTIVRSERRAGEVRVASFSETTRGDEGIIFQRLLRIAPGRYSLRLTATDSLGSGSGAADYAVVVPSLPDGSAAPLIPVFNAEPRRTRGAALAIVANPRSTVRYGRDTAMQVYLEVYGAASPDTIFITAQRDAPGAPTLFADTLVMPSGSEVRAARSTLPVSRLGLGPIRVSAASPSGQLDAMTAAVNLGIDIPVASVDELVEAMRHFVPAAELQPLRNASAAARPGQWATLVRRTDPNPATPDNEALLEYARRLRVADRLFRAGNVPGWRGERGAVLAALGEPDMMSGPQVTDSLGSVRVIAWEYRRHRLTLHFMEASEPGSWRLTPLSDAHLQSLLAVSGPCVGCR